jgi:hypothetical protein
MNSKREYFIERLTSITAAVILLQTLYFKFSAAEESVYIFNSLHAEPWGRIISGIVELMAGSLLVFRKTSVYGAFIGFGVIIGAILSHLLILGIEVQNDGGKLFMLAVAVLICCSITLFLRRKDIQRLIYRRIKL